MIYVGSDHGGFELKEHVAEYLKEKGIEFEECGTYSSDSCDYPDIAENVANKVVADKGSYGILVCGTGIGISIAANKVKGIRAACCSDTFSARYTRKHNDANILCFGGRVIGPGMAEELIDAFLGSDFEGGRHAKRVAKITEIENKE